MSGIETTKLLLLVVLYLIGFTSFVFYLSDYKAATYEGKATKVPHVKGAKLIIQLSFYGTLLICTLSVFAIHTNALLLMWDQSVLRLIGMFISIAGISLFIAAKLNLGSSYTPCFNSYLPHQLVRRGVYARIRHPIYSANMLIFLGAFVAVGSVWIGFFYVLITSVYVKTIRLEEAALVKGFENYSEYIRHTGQFFPRLVSVPQPSTPAADVLPFKRKSEDAKDRTSSIPLG